jgi:hypothetical protein
MSPWRGLDLLAPGGPELKSERTRHRRPAAGENADAVAAETEEVSHA